MSSNSHPERATVRKSVIENFNGARVSWADLYVRNAQLIGYDVQKTTTSETVGHKIFLGDTLPGQMGYGGLNLYFLAAADGTENEYVSARRTDAVTTVSSAEKRRLLNAFPDLDPRTISVDGFPVYNQKQIVSALRGTEKSTKDSVAFVGRTDSDKGLELELAIAEELRRAHILTAHLSAGRNMIAHELTSLDVVVKEGLSGDAYLGALSEYGAVVNTSPRESLYVSGIEATALGLPVFSPNATDSGIRDWNLDDRFYNPRDIKGAVAAISETLEAGVELSLPDVSRYSVGAYFDRIDALLERNND